ncbi:MAG: hypothetical protein JO013_14630 [Alphaproteobacteria bacterium]|nr:hypothetical protein [Alphaproteobacteria bacterium]
MLPPIALLPLAAGLLTSAPVPPAGQPTRAEVEAALLAHQVRLAAHPLACRKGLGCLVPPKAIEVRDYDCQTIDADAKGAPILFCRVTYIHKGGSFAHVKSPNECVPLRARDAAATDQPAWEVALVDAKGRCPGARE